MSPVTFGPYELFTVTFCPVWHLRQNILKNSAIQQKKFAWVRIKNALFILIAGKETQLCLKRIKPTRVATSSLTLTKNYELCKSTPCVFYSCAGSRTGNPERERLVVLPARVTDQNTGFASYFHVRCQVYITHLKQQTFSLTTATRRPIRNCR